MQILQKTATQQKLLKVLEADSGVSEQIRRDQIGQLNAYARFNQKIYFDDHLNFLEEIRKQQRDFKIFKFIQPVKASMSTYNTYNPAHWEQYYRNKFNYKFARANNLYFRDE